ncbi:hypothetical protein L249_3807, partial [Ophiocordyceps polyrhachis-furcata BCC 54312]
PSSSYPPCPPSLLSSAPPSLDSRRPPPLLFPISRALRNSNYRVYTIDPPTLSGVASPSHGPPALYDIRDGQVPPIRANFLSQLNRLGLALKNACRNYSSKGWRLRDAVAQSGTRSSTKLRAVCACLPRSHSPPTPLLTASCQLGPLFSSHTPLNLYDDSLLLFFFLGFTFCGDLGSWIGGKDGDSASPLDDFTFVWNELRQPSPPREKHHSRIVPVLWIWDPFPLLFSKTAAGRGGKPRREKKGPKRRQRPPSETIRPPDERRQDNRLRENRRRGGGKKGLRRNNSLGPIFDRRRVDPFSKDPSLTHGSLGSSHHNCYMA